MAWKKENFTLLFYVTLPYFTLISLLLLTAANFIIHRGQYKRIHIQHTMRPVNMPLLRYIPRKSEAQFDMHPAVSQSIFPSLT